MQQIAEQLAGHWEREGFALFVMLSAGLALSSLVLLATTTAFYLPRNVRYRLRAPRKRPMGTTKFRRVVVLNSLFSIFVVYGLAFGFYDYIYYEGPITVWRSLFEGVLIIALYDTGYYLIHRYLFHEWKILRWVHVVHHVVKEPSAVDSLYLHPIECFMGLGLLWGCAYIVGPVSVYTFGWVFAVYSVLNILIHSGLKFRVFPLSVITAVAKRHDAHHRGMQAQNYSSVTPIWDLVLGTEVR